MKAVQGNKTIELTKDEFLRLLQNFKRVELDMGTGDGRFVYEEAKKNPEILYIGVDPAEKQLKLYAVKSNKNKLNNVLFVVGSVEILPEELTGIADKLYVHLPWGTLLAAIVGKDQKSLEALLALLKPSGEFEALLGYDTILEISESKRLDLPELTFDYLNTVVIPNIQKTGNFGQTSLTSLTNKELFGINTSWGKKLSFGNERTFYLIRQTRSNLV